MSLKVYLWLQHCAETAGGTSTSAGRDTVTRTVTFPCVTEAASLQAAAAGQMVSLTRTVEMQQGLKDVCVFGKKSQ